MKRNIGLFLLFIGVFAAQAFSQRYAMFPQYAVGNGWESELFFTNQGSINLNDIRIYFYNPEGDAQTIVTSIGTGSILQFDLNAGATEAIQLNSDSGFIEGYIVIEYPMAFAPIRASEIYRYSQGGEVKAALGVPQLEFSNHFSFPVKMSSAEGKKTALVMVNPAAYGPSGAVDQTLILNLIRTNGTVQATAAIPLSAGKHLAAYLDEAELFDGLDDFVGSLSISSPFGAGVLALRQDDQAFGSIATDYGPIVRPLSFYGPENPLAEPNDTPAEAPIITNSAVLTGVIDPVGDLDYVKFEGNQGEIVSVLCETQRIGSYLNSVLELYDESLNLIAQNNRIGFNPMLNLLWGSFIQMMLPADGTYYILVKPYNDNNVGPDFTYRLHVKLP